MSSILVMLVVTTTLVALTALYVAAEFATVSARRQRISRQATAGDRLAQLLEPIMASPARLDTYIAACQVGITVSSLVLGFYGQSAIAGAIAPMFSQLGGLQATTAQSVAATVVLVVLTIFHVVLGELVPKSVALRYPERLARLTVVPMRWSMALFRPLIALFNGSGVLILRLLGVPPAEHHMHVHSPEEIELLVAESAKGGLLEPDERQLLRNAFHVGELTATQVMVPRMQTVVAPIDTPLRVLLELAVTTPIPVSRSTAQASTTSPALCISKTCSACTSRAVAMSRRSCDLSHLCPRLSRLSRSGISYDRRTATSRLSSTSMAERPA
jgi:putative hemolysin